MPLELFPTSLPSPRDVCLTVLTVRLHPRFSPQTPSTYRGLKASSSFSKLRSSFSRSLSAQRGTDDE